jgi:hypothetical protein
MDNRVRVWVVAKCADKEKIEVSRARWWLIRCRDRQRIRENANAGSCATGEAAAVHVRADIDTIEVIEHPAFLLNTMHGLRVFMLCKLRETVLAV